MTPAARVQNLTKRFGDGPASVLALDDVSLDVAAATFTAVMGPSGSGKSTLMNLMAGLDRPTGGHAWIGDREITSLPDDDLTELRRTRVGFVFQQFNLLPTLSATANVRLPFELRGRAVTADEAARADSVLALLGLADRAKHRPSELSGGQQQRVAIARALVTNPAVIFADEPTGNLDRRSSRDVLDVLARSVDELGQTVVMVTHDPAAAARASRVLFLADGRIVHELRGESTRADISEVMDALEGEL